MYKTASKFSWFSWAAFLALFVAFGCDSYTAKASSEERTGLCTQPIPEFKLVPDARLGKKWNPTDEQITKLCGCIWAKFPVGGWERETSRKIRAGETPGWLRNQFLQRLRKAFQECSSRGR